MGKSGCRYNPVHSIVTTQYVGGTWYGEVLYNKGPNSTGLSWQQWLSPGVLRTGVQTHGCSRNAESAGRKALTHGTTTRATRV